MSGRVGALSVVGGFYGAGDNITTAPADTTDTTLTLTDDLSGGREGGGSSFYEHGGVIEALTKLYDCEPLVWELTGG